MFEWLAGIATPPTLQHIAVGADEDAQWTPPPMAQAWGRAIPLETIRFAAANYLCVNLGYHGTKRIIEPYSLRSTKHGDLILHAIRADNREHRSYRVDEIQSAEVTQQGFSPIYAVELTPVGLIHAPLRSRSGSAHPRGKTLSTRGRASFAPTLKYIMECSACGKRFTRSRMDTTLNAHKDKNGYPCYGRYGHFIGTKYS